MDCDVAREALSARIDGEREAVPSTRVDEHLETCAACASWYRAASEQAIVLATLAGGTRAVTESDAEAEPVAPSRRSALFAARCAMAAVGVVQLGLAAAQVFGVDFGLVAGHHGASSGAHLLNESTAWSGALGIALILAAVRPVFAAGVFCVAALYALGLVYYVAADTMAGQVTAERAVSHLPVVLGAALALTIWRLTGPSRPPRRQPESTAGRAEPADVLSDRRRRKHLEAKDDSAA